MEWDKDKDKDKEKEKEKECKCCIKIEESIVVIICDEIEIDKLKDCVKTILEVKGNTNLSSK